MRNVEQEYQSCMKQMVYHKQNSTDWESIFQEEKHTVLQNLIRIEKTFSVILCGEYRTVWMRNNDNRME